MKDLIYKYLGYQAYYKDSIIDSKIDEAISIIQKEANFKYLYKRFDKLLPFLDKEPYASFLNESDGYYLIATSLGLEVDRRIKRESYLNMERSLILDSVASAYLEEKADLFEKTINAFLGNRFCPGYEGTDIKDNERILEVLDPKNTLGIDTLQSGLMIPLKTMVGIIPIGTKEDKSCKNCKVKDCKYKKRGITCYQK